MKSKRSSHEKQIFGTAVKMMLVMFLFHFKVLDSSPDFHPSSCLSKSGRQKVMVQVLVSTSPHGKLWWSSSVVYFSLLLSFIHILNKTKAKLKKQKSENSFPRLLYLHFNLSCINTYKQNYTQKKKISRSKTLLPW